MFCKNCGAKNNDGSRFCENCGAELEMMQAQKEPMKGKKKSPANKKKGKAVVISIVVVILLVALIAALVFALQKKKEKDFAASIETGDKYLEEMDYEQAKAAYLAAIEIDPKQEEPYLKLAEILVAENEPEKAVKILEQGKKHTDSKKIEEKYTLYSYVEDVLVPQYGQCEEGTYELAYHQEDEYAALVERVSEQSGVITSRIKDFDGDKDDELLVVMMKNDVPNEWNSSIIQNAFYLQMYECVDGKVELSAEFEGGRPFFGVTDEESTGVFIKETEEQIYICTGVYTLAHMMADGSSFTSAVLTYDGEFQVYTGCVEGMSGSDFSWVGDEAEEMADKLEAIGLIKAAEDVRNTWMTRLTYEDEGIDTLFRVEGGNVGGSSIRYYQTKDVSALGKVVLKFWIGTLTEEEKAERLLPPAVSQEEVDSLRAEMELLDKLVNGEIDASSFESQAGMTAAAGSSYDQWRTEMYIVYEILRGYLSETDAEALVTEQDSWREESEAQADAAAEDFVGGSMYPMVRADAMYEACRTRAYELLERLEELAE